MTEEAAKLLKLALNLPVRDRAELAGTLLESLDTATDDAVASAWEAEIDRRMRDLDSGRVKPVSLQEVQRRLSSAVE